MTTELTPMEKEDDTELTFLFDTSVLWPIICDRLGLQWENTVFSVLDVICHVDGGNMGIQKDVKKQILNLTRQQYPTYHNKVKLMLNDEFESIQVSNIDGYLKKVWDWQQVMVNNPNHEWSWDWVWLKRTMLRNHDFEVPERKADMRNMKKKPEALRFLFDEVNKGKDRQILAQAMKASEKRMITFISNDGDHVALMDTVKATMDGRFSIWRPTMKNH